MSDSPENINNWNYRVLRREYGNGEVIYSIYEVHYVDGIPTASGLDAAATYAESMGDLQDILEKMKNGMMKPILDYKTLKEIRGA